MAFIINKFYQWVCDDLSEDGFIVSMIVLFFLTAGYSVYIGMTALNLLWGVLIMSAILAEPVFRSWMKLCDYKFKKEEIVLYKLVSIIASYPILIILSGISLSISRNLEVLKKAAITFLSQIGYFFITLRYDIIFVWMVILLGIYFILYQIYLNNVNYVRKLGKLSGEKKKRKRKRA